MRPRAARRVWQRDHQSGSRLDTEILRFENELGESVAVEFAHERGQRVVERAPKPASWRDQAIVLRAKTFHQGEIRLRRPQYVAQPDLVRQFGEGETSGAPPNGLEKSRPSQLIGHLHQMRTGNPVQLSC